MKTEIQKHVEMLGLPAKDKVTGFTGVVSSVSFDLYGCVQAVVTPPVDDKGDSREGHWFDVSRLEVTDGVLRVIDVPNFSKGYVAEGNKGPAEKPAR